MAGELLGLNSPVVMFDIETTGLTLRDEIVSYSWKVGDEPARSHTRWVDDAGGEAELLKSLRHDIVGEKRPDQTIICTYNGQNWQGGFDLIFVRTRLAKHKLPWPFHFCRHYDMYPAIQKMVNTKLVKPGVEEEDGRRKKDKITENNKLDFVYQEFGGPTLGYEDWDGAMVPVKYAEFLKTKDIGIMRDIAGYNRTDVEQLKYVYDLFIESLPAKSKLYETL